VPIIEQMTIERMEHVGIVVEDLADAVAFFATLGLELQGEAPVGGRLGGLHRRARGRAGPRSPSCRAQTGTDDSS
jgi:catechol 2,3-dioxygenase-like lactoylglutathione lyase family enzyme